MIRGCCYPSYLQSCLGHWVIYSPTRQLVASGGACLGPTTNNMVEYRVVSELLQYVSYHSTSCLEVRIESKLVVSQLNGDYRVRNPSLLCHFLKI